MKTLITLLVALFLAGTASASVWEDCIDDVAIGPMLQGGQIACFEFNENAPTEDLQSPLLRVDRCDNIDIVYDADDTGTETTMTLQILSCVTTTVSTNSCKPIDNITLTGASTSFEILGAAAFAIYAQGTTDPVSTTPRVLVKCNR